MLFVVRKNQGSLKIKKGVGSVHIKDQNPIKHSLNIMRGFKNQKKKTIDLNYIYKNELDKACFAHDAVYANGRDLAQRTVSVKILKKAYEIALNPKCD